MHNNTHPSPDAQTLVEACHAALMSAHAGAEAQNWLEKPLALWRAVVEALCHTRDTEGTAFETSDIIGHLALPKVEGLYIRGYRQFLEHGQWPSGFAGVKAYLEAGLPAYRVENLLAKHGLAAATLTINKHPGLQFEQNPMAKAQHATRVAELLPAITALLSHPGEFRRQHQGPRPHHTALISYEDFDRLNEEHTSELNGGKHFARYDFAVAVSRHVEKKLDAEFDLEVAQYNEQRNLRLNLPRQGAQEVTQQITPQAARAMGAQGGEATEHERLLFEQWMAGHCWAVVGTWDGKTYVHELERDGEVLPKAMNTRQLWAAWRDRAALERQAQSRQYLESDFLGSGEANVSQHSDRYR